ncbi:MAG: hypothetical protein JW908_00575 [Anaerolineales bacterium]|nr:hypothetical protein [Anaerolineales bacterium]
MAYGETTLRARLKTVISAVSNIGVVHDYERWLEEWGDLLKLFKSTIGGIDQLRGWIITLTNWSEQIVGFQGGGDGDTVLVNYTYKIRGFMGVDDSAATEKTMTALALAVSGAIKADTTLAAYHLTDDIPTVATGLVEYRTFCGVLCHYVEIIVNLQEVV